MKVLCLEDDILALKTLQKNLERINDIDEVFTFEYEMDEVIEYIKSEFIDIAILDVHLQTPKYDGVDIASKIHEYSPETYLLFASDYNDVYERILKAGIGQVDFLEKPYEFEKIQAKINDILSIKKGRGQPPANCHIVIRTFGSLQIIVDGECVNSNLFRATKQVIAACINDYDKTLDKESIASKAYNKNSIDDANLSYEYIRQVRKEVTEKNNKFINEILEISAGKIRFKFENFENNTIWCDLLEYKKGNFEVLRYYNHEYLTDIKNEDATWAIKEELEKAYENHILNQ